MDQNNVTIRLEKKEEYREVENLVRESFWNVYRPGCLEHYVLHQLRDDPAFVKELDFVMERDGKIIGQNMFMRAAIQADDGRQIPVMAMGPICIANDLKRKGFGKILLDYSLEKARELGCGAVCFEGNIDFYGKSGLTYASTFGIRYHDLPEGEDAPFFLCKELIPGYLDGITGVYTPPKGYFVDEAEAEAFDKGFPYKEKQKLAGEVENGDPASREEKNMNTEELAGHRKAEEPMTHIRNFDDFCRELLFCGFPVGGGNVKGMFALIDYNWTNQDALDTPVKWHCGDPEVDPWEWRMRVLEERRDIAYSKVFFKTSGFITRDAGWEAPYWRSPWYARIDNIHVLDAPVSIDQFRDFIKVSRTGAITKLTPKQEALLQNLVAENASREN